MGGMGALFVLGLLMLAGGRKPTRARARAEPEPEQTKPKRVPKPSGGKAKRTAEDAAMRLQAYLLGGGDFGWRGRASDNVERAQKLMGGVVPDGIVGPATRRRAKQLGFELPVRPPAISPEQAARKLAAYLKRTGRFGSRTDRVPQVRLAQRDMGLRAAQQDGIVGPTTRARAAAFGVTLPVRTRSSGFDDDDLDDDEVGWGDERVTASGYGGEFTEGQANYEPLGGAIELTSEEIALEHAIRNTPWQQPS